MTKPIIFISYSHKDEAWKDKLQTHLKVLERQGDIEIWEDRQIKAGENWHPKIIESIEHASVAILLISADFLTSEFILGEEIPNVSFVQIVS